jgi:uncharacterized membrane protein
MFITLTMLYYIFFGNKFIPRNTVSAGALTLAVVIPTNVFISTILFFFTVLYIYYFCKERMISKDDDQNPDDPDNEDPDPPDEPPGGIFFKIPPHPTFC